MNKKKVSELVNILSKVYGGTDTALIHENPYELMVSTILAAQCTDVRVNKVTEVLYKKANTPEEMIKLSYDELYQIIKPCGLGTSKAPNILNASKMIIEKFDGRVPRTREELMQLPGVGRKTANVILSVGFGVAAIAVDTHVQRVSNRIGLANSPQNVLKTEESLMKWIDENMWSAAHHWLIWHGRRICHARSPECESCPVLSLCEWENKPKP